MLCPRPQRHLLAVALLCTTLAACESPSLSEKEVLRDLQYFGMDMEHEYSQGLALGLNFLPGFGNFYLHQYGLGVVNLLTWPVSILWGMPQAWHDAENLNLKHTVDFYRTRAGQSRMEDHLIDTEVPPEDWPHWVD